MTSKAGHTFTAGPATVLRSKRLSDGEYDFAVNCEGAPVIAEAFGRAADGEGSILPAEANARLIAEAFNVAHETGLTPRQLAERCAKLEAFAQAVIEADQEGHMMPTWMVRDARAAIAKATAGGAV
jgi:hypothetical protein